jgi:hypothetical protein
MDLSHRILDWEPLRILQESSLFTEEERFDIFFQWRLTGIDRTTRLLANRARAYACILNEARRANFSSWIDSKWNELPQQLQLEIVSMVWSI